MQSPFPSAHTYRSARSSNIAYYFPVINCGSRIFLLTLVLTGALAGVSAVSDAGRQDSGSVVFQIKAGAVSDQSTITLLGENPTYSWSTDTHPDFYRVEPEHSVRNHGFYVNNRAQGFRMRFSDGAARLTVNQTGADQDNEPLRKARRAADVRETIVRFIGAGYGDRIQLASGTTAMTGSSDRFAYQHQLSAQNQSAVANVLPVTVEEWYLNKSAGIEHGFTLSAPPSARQAGELLRVGMKIESGLRVQGIENGQGLVLAGAGQSNWLSYDGLKVTDAAGRVLEARMRVTGQTNWFEVRDEGATYPLTIDPVWTRGKRATPRAGPAKEQLGFSVATRFGAGDAMTNMLGSLKAQGLAYNFVRDTGGVDHQDDLKDLFVSEGGTNDPPGNLPSFVNPAAPFTAPIITITGSCDTFGNSIFTIKNLGGAMTTNYTWEIYQNNVLLTSGVFLLTAAGTPSDTQQLTINGLYGNLAVAIKNGTTPAAVEIARATAFCVERPTVSVKQAVGQADPTTSTPIRFDVTFSKAVTDFTSTDVTIAGMAATPGKTVTDSGDHIHFSASITGMADGETVVATIPQDAAHDADGNGNRISTYLTTDHSVTYHAPPNITVSGTCDAFGNSVFTITNIGGAMTSNYTWEIYQNSVLLTSGVFLLTKAGTPGDSQQLTINGLYGNIMVAIKNGTTPAAVQIASATAFCVDSSPTVTINQASTQSDPTRFSPINFDVVFSAAVSGFINTDVNISGMAGTPVKTVTDSGDHIHFSVAVTGMADGETVRATIPAGRAFLVGHSDITNRASTSTDNHVTYDISRPNVTINQASGQADPTDVSPILFDVTFSEAITGFTSSDVNIAGLHGTPGITLTDSGDHRHFTVAITGMANHDQIIATIPSNVASDAAGNLSVASTFTDNRVTFADTTPPAVTVEQSSGQADPVKIGPIHFVATFSEPIDVNTFTNADITLGGTAGATSAVVTEIAPNNHTTFDISVSGMTANGTVTASLTANKIRDLNGNFNTASTSVDNTVTYDTSPPTVTIDQAVGQADPANNSPINFQVIFSEPVTDFDDDGDVVLSGTAGANKISITGGPTNYNVAVSGMTSDGTVIASIPANAARDAANNLSTASTSSDNTVTFEFCAANPIVTSTADNGPNTLRDALAKICSAPNNNITFDVGPGGKTILLTSGQLDIQKDVSITNTISDTNGPLTINGNNTSRVLLNGLGVTTSINGLIITNGNNNSPGPRTGSGLRNDGTLSLSNVVVTGNHMMAQGEGGGIYNEGTLTIIDSTISNNQGAAASFGAGIASAGGSVSMMNCTVSGNTGPDQGGGIKNSAGIFTITNSTIAANSAISGGGIYNDVSGSMTIINSTVSRNSASGNGGGINNPSVTVSLRNSIIALNTAISSGPDIFGRVISQGFNLIGNNSDAMVTPIGGDQIGTSSTPIDPLLGVLGDYGGPTQTLKLLAGSPALDQGDSSGSTFDQRGLPRPVDYPAITNAADGADIGAYEMAPAPTITPSGPTAFCTGGGVTLTSSSASGNQWFLDGNPISGETNPTYVATASGNYTVEANNVTSLVTTVTVSPIPPTPTITPGGATTFCAGGSVTLVSSSASGNQWYLDGNPIVGAFNQDYVATASGDYTVIGITPGCSSMVSSPTTVTVNPIPATPTITSLGPTTFCDDGIVTLISSSASGNQWYLDGNPISGETDRIYIASASGNYTVAVTTSGCASAPSAPMTVTVNPTPATPKITPGGPTSFCTGGSVKLTSNSVSGNQWYLDGSPISGATNQTYIASTSGNYTDTVTASACISTESAAISVTASPLPQTPTIIPSGATAFCEGGNVMLTSSSAAGNQWYLNGSPIDGATNQTYVATAAGSYTVAITDSVCTGAASPATTVTVNSIPPTPTITPQGPTTFVSGGNVMLKSSSVTGNQWYLNGNPIVGETNENYIATASGDYTVVVTTSGCASTPSAPTTVTVVPNIAYAEPSGVCGGGNTPCFSTIQAAINALTSGGTVNVIGGTFNEDVNLNTNVVLNINGNTTINSLTLSAGIFNGSVGAGCGGNCTLTLASGDWTNNGAFVAGTGRVSFTGSGQSIGGTSPTPFYNLTIGAGGTILNSPHLPGGGENMAPTVASVDVSVNGQLTLNGDLTTTGAANLIMSASATSTGTGDVIGNVQRTGFLTGACADAPCANTLSFGNPNNQITITGGTAPTSILVNLAKSAPATYAAAVQRNYNITQTGGSGFTATLRLHYLDSELNFNPEANLNLRRFNGTTWPAVLPSVVDTTNNWVESNAVTDFSQWTFAALAPTVASGIISGRILGDDGRPIEGAVVRLSGTQLRKTITDANGNYHFNEVETNGFYSVTPSRANYNFSPFNRSFSQVGNQTEAVFTAHSMGDDANPLDTPEYFVRQQYLDVLRREPDEAGFNYWSNKILACGDDASCTRAQRTGVAAAFFIENEAQITGSFIFDVYSGTLGRRPAYAEYAVDREGVVGGATLDTAKTVFAQKFVQRAEFMTKYQNAMTADSFVDALILSVQSAGGDLSSERSNLTGIYNQGADLVTSRAAVVRSLADNAAFKQSQYNQAFVLTEYFSYLGREIDLNGYTFWVRVLNTGDRGNYRGMVCSFVTSMEYQNRFSSVVSHSNSECGQ